MDEVEGVGEVDDDDDDALEVAGLLKMDAEDPDLEGPVSLVGGGMLLSETRSSSRRR